MRFDKPSRKIHIKTKKKNKSPSPSFFVFLSIGLGLLVLFLVVLYRGHEKELKKIRQEKIREDMNTIFSALLMFFQENRFFPTEEQGLSALVKKPEIPPIPSNYPEGGYMSRIPVDPWGNNYLYKVLESGDNFDLICLGADGILGGEGEDADIHLKKKDL